MKGTDWAVISAVDGHSGGKLGEADYFSVIFSGFCLCLDHSVRKRWEISDSKDQNGPRSIKWATQTPRKTPRLILSLTAFVRDPQSLSLLLDFYRRLALISNYFYLYLKNGEKKKQEINGRKPSQTMRLRYWKWGPTEFHKSSMTTHGKCRGLWH